MWPAKLDGEGVNLYKACEAMCSIMEQLGIAVDGGKDSLSMATRLRDGEVVKSPGKGMAKYSRHQLPQICQFPFSIYRNIGNIHVRSLPRHS